MCVCVCDEQVISGVISGFLGCVGGVWIFCKCVFDVCVYMHCFMFVSGSVLWTVLRKGLFIMREEF